MSDRKPNYKAGENLLRLYILIQNSGDRNLSAKRVMKQIGVSMTTLNRYMEVIARVLSRRRKK